MQASLIRNQQLILEHVQKINLVDLHEAPSYRITFRNATNNNTVKKHFPDMAPES